VWPRRGIALLAGLSATAGHAPFQLTLVYALAIVALIWLLDAAASRPRPILSAFGAGWWFGLGHMGSGLYWVSSAFMVDSDAWGPLWGIPAALALAGSMAIFWGVGCALAMSLWTRDLRRLPVLAAALFVSEWLRGHLFGGFPWLLPGYVWTPGEQISQLASLFGIYGLSLLTLLLCAAPAAIADRSGAWSKYGPMLIAGLALGMAWGWGAQRLDRAPVDPPGAQPIVRVADSGLSQAEKWAPRADQEWRVLRRYLDATGPAEDSRASIVIWPEGAIPVVNFFMLENPDFMSAIGRALGDRVLVTGLSRRELREDGLAYFNSAAVIDGVSGTPRLSQTYDKHRLVPFGEFIPLWSLVSRFNIAPLQRIGAGFEAGPPPSRLVVPDAAPAVVLICYEAIFPGIIPRGEERPGWIISVTNDAWFGGGLGPHHHFAMARYRAIEEGLPLARAASGGASAIVDSYGRSVVSTWARGGAVEVQLPPALVETTWSRYGNLLTLILLVIFGALRFVRAGRRIKP
jgi:apolipoprotein N-acyltransferase